MTEVMEKIESVVGFGIGNITVSAIIKVVVMIAICILAIKIITKVIDKALLKTKIEKGLHNFIKSVVKIVLWIVAILIIADTVGIPITSLLALFSVAGLAVSLALQDTLSNLANGVMILITKPFKTGDVIDAGGIVGTVEEIELIYTKLKSPDKTIYIPNSQVAANKIMNFSNLGTRRIDITISAAYESKIEDVKKAINEVLEENKDKILQDPVPFVKLKNYAESYIEYCIIFWIKQEDYVEAYYGVLEGLKPAFDRNNVEMTYNHLNVHLDK